MNRLLLVLGCLLLACTAHAGKADKAGKPNYMYKARQGQGTMMLRIISNRDIALQAHWWNFLTLKRKGDLMVKDINRLIGFDGGDAFFVQSLPPGEYTLMQVSTSGYENSMLKNFWATFDEGAWSFKIEAGRMTNLGTLFYLNGDAPDGEVRYRWLHYPDPNLPQRSAYLFNPDDYPQLLSAQINWTKAPAAAAWPTLKTWERQISLKLGGGTLAKDGGRLFGEFMGQVAWRHVDGSWAWEDTGTIETISTAIDASDGTRYAFAHSSHMLRRQGPNDWRRVTVPFDGAEPCYVEAQARGDLLVVWDRDTSIVVLHYQPGADPEWETVYEFDTPISAWGLSGGCQAVSNGQKMVLVQTYYTAKRRLLFLDLATKEGVGVEFKNSEAFDMLPDGTIYTMNGNEAKRQLRVTKDLARTWETFDAHYFMKTLYRTPEEAIALRSFGLMNKDGSVAGNRSLWGTSDGGKTWNPMATLVKDTDNVIPLQGKGLLFTTSTGLLYSWSGLKGGEVRVERTPVR